MHLPTVQAVISLLVVSSMTSGFAAGPAIGIAMASGPFEINRAEVKGNASLFEGTELRTTLASSKLRINGGSRLEVGTESQVKVFSTHTVLEKGAGQIENGANYRLDARTFRVMSDTKAIARVQLDDADGVLVSAVNGPVSVATSSGVLLAKLAAGHSLHFRQEGAADDFDLAGCLLKKSGRVILVDQTTGQIFELRGADASTEFGNRVSIKGKGVAGATPVQGAAKVIGVQSLAPVAPGGCIAAAANAGADPLPGATTSASTNAPKVPKSGGGANKAVIAGVAVAAAAGAGIAVALGGKNKSQ